MEAFAYIVRSAWRDSGPLVRALWLIGFVVPSAMATQANERGLPWLKDVAQIWPWWAWLFVGFYVALLFLLLQIGRKAKRFEDEKNAKFKVTLGDAITTPGIKPGALPPVSIQIENNSDAYIEDAEVHFLSVDFKKDGSHATAVSRIMRFAHDDSAQASNMNPRARRHVILGYIKTGENPQDKFLVVDNSIVKLQQENWLRFDISAKSIRRRTYSVQLGLEPIERLGKKLCRVHTCPPAECDDVPW